MPSLYIMVTHITYHISHIIHHIRRNMSRHGIHEIIIVSCRLTLQDIPIIHQQAIIPIFLTLFFHKGMNTGKTSTPFFPFDKVIRKEIPVHITGFYNLDNHFFLIIGCRQLHTRPQQQGADTYSIFHFSILYSFLVKGCVNTNRAPSV